MAKSITNQQFIAKAIEIHGNKYDYSKVNYINSQTKVSIICKKHGIFMQVPNSHVVKGYGCKQCSIDEKRLDTTKFIEKSKIIHDNEYDYSKVNYINSRTKVSIVCKKHGTFEQLPTNHLNGHICNKCSCELVGKKLASNSVEFITKAIEVHGDKYDYSKVDYVNCIHNINIICKKHGIFSQLPSNHLSGAGCKKCANCLHIGGYNIKNRHEFEHKMGSFYNIILEHMITGETFNKVGISIDVDCRFKQYNPYKLVGVLECTEMLMGDAFDKEREFIDSMDRYTPNYRFNGYTECYLP